MTTDDGQSPRIRRWSGTGWAGPSYAAPAGPGDDALSAADSWLVSDGRTLAIDLHRQRFASAVGAALPDRATGEIVDAFWDAAIAEIPRVGDWFPRVEARAVGGEAQLQLRLRPAPVRTRSVRVRTHRGVDPRTSPTVKGPDLAAMRRLRESAAADGADEVALLSTPEGFVVEGAYSALLWWRGDALCAPSTELERVDSVTARTVITLAGALGVDVLYESVEPDDLDGLEIWAVNALHGIRIVTSWQDGPQPAEKPGRLSAWRERLGKLSRPLVSLQ